MKEQKPTRPIAQRPEVSVPDVPSAPNDGLSPPRRDGHRLDEWRFLSEASGRLNSSLKLADVLQEIASGVHDLVDCHFFTVLLWSESENVLRPAFALKFGQCVDIEGSISLGEGLTGVAAAQRRPVRVADLRCDSRSRRASGATMDVRSKLTIPLVFQERLVGVLDLESLEPGLFTEDHEHLLLALGAHMATAL
jgi:sigma-B regulation protein RsbU (phosphoserine phosphatase)